MNKSAQLFIKIRIFSLIILIAHAFLLIFSIESRLAYVISNSLW